jgi:hypothetical protein
MPDTGRMVATCRASTKKLMQLERPDSLLTVLGSTPDAKETAALRRYFDDTRQLKAANATVLRRQVAASKPSRDIEQMIAALTGEAAHLRTAAEAIDGHHMDRFADELADAAASRDRAVKAADETGLEACARLGGFGRPSEATYTDLGSGKAFDNECSNTSDFTSAVSCDAPHMFELFGGWIIRGDGRPFPGEETLFMAASDGCTSQFSSYVGLDMHRSVFSIKVLTPNETAWAQRDYSIYCVLQRRDRNPTIGSAFKVEQ